MRVFLDDLELERGLNVYLEGEQIVVKIPHGASTGRIRLVDGDLTAANQPMLTVVPLASGLHFSSYDLKLNGLIAEVERVTQPGGFESQHETARVVDTLALHLTADHHPTGECGETSSGNVVRLCHRSKPVICVKLGSNNCDGSIASDASFVIDRSAQRITAARITFSRSEWAGSSIDHDYDVLLVDLPFVIENDRLIVRMSSSLDGHVPSVAFNERNSYGQGYRPDHTRLLEIKKFLEGATLELELRP